MSYDVLAVCQVATLRPLLSVRLVHRCAKLETAEFKVREMQRSLEFSKARGQERFVISPCGTYRHGELWKGDAETMNQRQASVVSAAVALVKTFQQFPDRPRSELELGLWKAVDVLQEAETVRNYRENWLEAKRQAARAAW